MKKYLLSLLCLLGAGLTAQAADEYELVKSVTDIDLNGTYVLITKPFSVGTVKYGLYGMSTTAATNGFKGTVVDQNATNLPETFSTTLETLQKFKFDAGTIEGSTLKCNIKTGDNYWYASAAKKLKHDASNKTAYEVTIDATDNTVSIKSTHNSTATLIRITAQNSSGKQGNTTFNNYDKSQQGVPALYKLKEYTGIEPEMKFNNQIIYGKVGIGTVWQQVKVITPEGEHGKITYSSSDPNIVAVDTETGRILPEDVKAEGEVEITAIMEANGEYGRGKASYTILVKDPSITATPGTTTFDFTTENPYGLTTQTGSSYESLKNEIKGDNGTITIKFYGKYRSYGNGNSYDLRLAEYNASNPNKFEITAPEGYKITKVGITSSGGSIKINDEAQTKDSGEFVWLGEEANPTNKITVESSATSSKLVISKINVMYQTTSNNLQPAQLTFLPNVNGIIVNEETEINGVNNPNNRPDVEYTIAGLENTEYSIVKKDDGKIAVTVNTPGSYTLEARTAEGDGFRDGFAIMRLNVFRHLDVFVDNSSDAITEDKIKTDTEKTVTIDVPANAHLYYKITPAPAAPEAYAAGDATEPDENLEAGYTEYDYDNGITIPAKTNGTLEYYIANYGYKSPKRRIALSFTTGVEEIEGVEEAPARYYDLNGREVKGDKLDSGVYIRLQGGKAEKVLVK